MDPNGAEAIRLPVGEMQAAVDRYFGAGSFGTNADPTAALAAARKLSPQVAADEAQPSRGLGVEPLPAEQRGATWSEVGRLRSSINEAMQKARLAGGRKAEAALVAQKQSIDAAIARDLSPKAQAAWMEANASHAAKMDRFHTGPQASIFRTSPNGEPPVQGGEVASKFWGVRPGLADDVEAFRRLVDDNPKMFGQFRSLITTEVAGTVDAVGNLSSRFSKWVSERLPGLREAFSLKEVETLQRIAQDIDRSAAAVKAGTSLGGSNTYQNTANALSLGLLDSPALTRAASMIPGVRVAAGPLLEGARGAARNAKAQRMSDLLSDSGEAANALQRLTGASASPRQVNTIVRALEASAYRTVPVAGSR